mgnify:FL=1
MSVKKLLRLLLVDLGGHFPSRRQSTILLLTEFPRGMGNRGRDHTTAAAARNGSSKRQNQGKNITTSNDFTNPSKCLKVEDIQKSSHLIHQSGKA